MRFIWEIRMGCGRHLMRLLCSTRMQEREEIEFQEEAMIMKKEEMKITELYDLTHTLASDYLKQFTYPWEALAGLSDFYHRIGEIA